MRIGIDASCWWNRRGFGRFTRELVSALVARAAHHDFVLFIDQPAEPEMNFANARPVRIATDRPVTEAARAASRRSLRDLWRFGRRAATEGLDVMFFPAIYSWFPVMARSVPSVVILHDAIAEHYPNLVFPDRRGRLLWTLKVALACRLADRLLTVSEAARSEIHKHLGIPEAHITVVGEGVAERFVPVEDDHRRRAARARTGIPAGVRIVLAVGLIAPHKNLGNLLLGFADALEADAARDLHLVLVGDPDVDGFHTDFHQLAARIDRDARLRGRVHRTGFIDDADLIALYSDALVVIVPSFSEGFGLPAVEAMACGTPVLCSRTGALPEVVDGAGRMFDPNDPRAIAEALVGIAAAPAERDQLARAALARAKRFTWARAAERTLAVLESSARRG